MASLTKSAVNRSEKTQVLILGGGFGGIKAALKLSDSPKFDVTLLSDQEDFRYYPTLYRAATGGRAVASQIPLPEIFKNKDARIVLGKASNLDRHRKTIETAAGEKYHYDVLIVALGSVTNYFGVRGLKEYSYGIKTMHEAKRLRDHLHAQLIEDKKPDVNYVVVGGGATGVELAGVLCKYINHIMKKHGLPKRSVRVDLVEAAPRLMPRMSIRYSKSINKRLRRLGVKLYLGRSVRAETADRLMIDEKPIASETVVWTAGVTNNPFLRENKFALTEHGKATVNEYLQAEPDIYVIGDNADTPYSGMAQTALRDSLAVTDNLMRITNGKQPEIYKPKRPVYVTPIGPYWAAVSWRKLEVFGFLGWLLRQAADLSAYHDLEPWWKASRRWIAESEREDDCPVCTPRKPHRTAKRV